MKSRKIISIILLILMLLNIIQSPVQAMNIPMKETYIEDLGECERHLQYWKESAGRIQNRRKFTLCILYAKRKERRWRRARRI